jgi:hypothetical protein
LRAAEPAVSLEGVIGRFVLFASLLLAALPSQAPPRALAPMHVADNGNGAGPPTYDDDDPSDVDDAFGDVDSDADDDCLPPLRFALGAPCASVRIVIATPRLPESAALASLFRPPRSAAV